MRPEKQKAIAGTMTSHNKLQVKLYESTLFKSNDINELLAKLLFGLQIPHLKPAQKDDVLNSIEWLIKLKIRFGLIKGKHHAA